MGRPVLLHLSAGQVSDYKGAEALLEKLPAARELLADRGYDADWFIDALKKRRIKPCIPSRRNRKKKRRHGKTLYKQRHKIENMFGRLKDWRRISMRYDRCSHTFMTAITIAAIVIYWL